MNKKTNKMINKEVDNKVNEKAYFKQSGQNSQI